MAPKQKSEAPKAVLKAKAAMAKPEAVKRSSSGSRCCGCLGDILRFFFYWVSIAMGYSWLLGLVDLGGVWSRFQDMPYSCEHPPIPGNNSGVKVMVAGFAKTGTRTLSRVLWQLGLEHSYHSEEFGFYMWGSHAQKFWTDYYNGSFALTPGPGAMHSLLQLDDYVLQKTSSEELAALYSKCRVDAIAFDGIENMFWPTYEVSPDAKVLVMNWRTFKEWRKSLETFGAILLVQIYWIAQLSGSMNLLPYGALFKYLDPYLFDRKLEKMLKHGGPAINQVYSPYVGFWHGIINLRYIAIRWSSGLQNFPSEEEEYNAYFDKVLSTVPKERVMQVNPRVHRYEDLCKFLEIKDCRRKGTFDKAENVLNFERDFYEAFWARLPLYIALHIINYKILTGLLGKRYFYCCCRRGRKSKMD